jgi:P4 family phage/plasmid primase-like protien
MKPINKVLDRLDVRGQSGGWHQAICPAHDDSSPSLGVKEGDTGAVIFKCHKGCEKEGILDALGLTWKDTFPKDQTKWNPWKDGRQIERYPYHDERGRVMFEVVRFEPKPSHPMHGRDKTFIQRVPGKGWGRKKYGVEATLYRLPEAKEKAEAGGVVFICEGEKDVHTLEEAGLTATTCPQGAGEWKPAYSRILAGAEVVIVPDNDDAGRNHALKVAQSVKAHAKNVRIVELPDLPRKGDVTDWFNAGGTADALKDLVRNTEPFSGLPEPKEDHEEHTPTFSLQAFRDALKGLSKTEAKMEAAGLLEKVATLPKSEAQKCRIVLEDAATVRFARSWMADVKAERKERQAASEQDKEATADDLKGGELTAWIAEQILSDDYFAKDEGGALYYYRDGRYVRGGKEYLYRRFYDVLEAHGKIKEASTYRRNEVLEFISVRLPNLWDAPPMDQICLENGVLDLESGTLHDHSPDWLSTHQIPIAYDPDADGTAWSDHFDAVLPDDAAEAGVGEELFAQLLVPAHGRRKATLFHGQSSTGKSITLANIQRALGLEAVSNMTLQELDNDPFAAANLYGRTLNVCADLPAEKLEGVSTFKRITGGDRISAQHKYKSRFSFTPFCHLIFSSNHALDYNEEDQSFWGRWLVIPFRNTFSKEGEKYEPSEEINDRLQNPYELSSLLNDALAVQGMRRGRVPGNLPSVSGDVSEEGVDTGSRPNGAETHVPQSPINGAEEGGTPPKNFLKSGKMGHGGGVSEKDTRKKVSSDAEATARAMEPYGTGKRVETPDGPGVVRELDYTAARVYVRPDDGLPSDTRGYDPEELSPMEAPF